MGVSLLVHGGFFLDGDEGVCAVVLVCCVPKWLVAMCFWYEGEGSFEVRLETLNSESLRPPKMGCRFTRYFSKNGNKYYFQVIWTHYCTQFDTKCP